MERLGAIWKYVAGLKDEERGGWKKLKLGRVESVADHSFALAVLVAIEGRKRNYDVEKAVTMALIHDLEEAITGDLTPAKKRALGSARVRRQKRTAIRELLRNLPPEDRKFFARLWTDLFLLRSKEARLVHELDKLEMAFQARMYAKKVGRKKVTDFYESADVEIDDESLRRVLDGLRSS